MSTNASLPPTQRPEASRPLESPPGAVQRYFGIRLESRLTCLTCSAVSRTLEFPCNIGLAIPHLPSFTNQAAKSKKSKILNIGILKFFSGTMKGNLPVLILKSLKK
jgi:hypothetical protein